VVKFKDIRKYHFHVRHRAAASGCTDDWNSINYTAASRKKGTVWAMPLKFRDGSSLRFEEEILIDDDGLAHRPSYAYHYEGPESHFHFRYDRDPEHHRAVVHEECHLHVIQKEPRFKTHATNFDEVFDFIVACFYSR